MLYKLVLTFSTVDEILKCDHSNESYRAGRLFVIVYEMAVTFESALGEVLKFDHSNESSSISNHFLWCCFWKGYTDNRKGNN